MIQVSFFKSRAPKDRKVCIAKWARFWTGPKADKFAPSNPRANDWAAAYLADLERRFPTLESLLEYLDEVETATPNPILCCYEADPAECHRTILAEFIFKMTGVEVKEWQPGAKDVAPRTARKPKREQCSLV